LVELVVVELAVAQVVVLIQALALAAEQLDLSYRY
jgi:hypothetical protein